MRHRLVLLPVLLATLVCAPPALAWTWPQDGPVLQPFVLGGDPYAAGQHRGIDVAGPPGAAVRAPTSGTVSFAGFVPSGGRTVTIQTADGLAVTLLHLGSLGVARGAIVGEGAIVGTLALEGDADHPVPYVQMGVRVAADPQGYLDPLAFLPVRAPAEAPTAPVEEPAADPVAEAPAEPETSPDAVAAPADPPVEADESVEPRCPERRVCSCTRRRHDRGGAGGHRVRIVDGARVLLGASTVRFRSRPCRRSRPLRPQRSRRAHRQLAGRLTLDPAPVEVEPIAAQVSPRTHSRFPVPVAAAADGTPARGRGNGLRMASPAHDSGSDTDSAAASTSPHDGDRGAARAPRGARNSRPAT